MFIWEIRPYVDGSKIRLGMIQGRNDIKKRCCGFPDGMRRM